jgi:hypothetical protein
MIKDSGNRRNFETGAVRDIQEGKGRCDLAPLDVVSLLLNSDEIMFIHKFQHSGSVYYLLKCLHEFLHNSDFHTMEEMVLEVSKHFEEGAKKYGENNWQKGIPLHSYFDSAIRHLLKYWNNETDERHDRAFCWNLMCAIWTFENKPELDDFTRKEDTNESNQCKG